MGDQEKVTENRLRRALDRRGLRLQKRRRNDPKAQQAGGFLILDPNKGLVVAGGGEHPFSLSLNGVQEWLENN